jgi:DNA helicase HerA-like ATPase
MERSALPERQRVPFFAHIDEFQSFSTDSFASLLSEARKFGAHFCLANQYTSQLTPAVRAAVFGNVGSMIVFRVGGEDAALLAPEFHPLPSATLAEQAPFEAWVRRGASGQRPVMASASLYPPRGSRTRVLAQSERNFGRRRGQIEQGSVSRLAPIKATPPGRLRRP